MTIHRLSALLAATLTLASCQLAQAPIDMLGRLFQAGGRTLHMSSETTRSPENLKLESHDVREALADGARIDVKPQDIRPELAQR